MTRALDLLRFGICTVLLLAMQSGTSTRACEIFGALSSSDVEFSRFVHNAHSIVLARVVRDDPIALDHKPDIYSTTDHFTFHVVERIKGDVPDDFSRDGQSQQLSLLTTRAMRDHYGVGSFWTAFMPYCEFGFPAVFAPSGDFLLFLDSNGAPIRYFDGRGVQLIVGDTDPWLNTVRALARDPKLKKVRSASLLEFLRSARAVALMSTESCDKSDYQPRYRLLKQLWGAPLTADELGFFQDQGISWDCVAGQQFLLVVQDRFFVMHMRVFGVRPTVTFTGLLDGSDTGILPDKFIRWYSQVSLQGKRTWMVSDLEAALHVPSPQTNP